MTTLNTYLETLVDEETMQKNASAHLGSMSVQELAAAAGIKLAESVCSKCGSQMTKSGAIMKCGCGMMKKSSKRKEALFTAPIGKGAPLARDVLRRSFGGTGAKALQTAEQRAAPLLTGAGGGELTAKELAALGPGRSTLAKLKAMLSGGGGLAPQPKVVTAGVKLSQEKIATVVLQLAEIHDGDLVKVAAVCESAGMEKEAIMPILRSLGSAAKGAWQAGTKAYGQSAARAAGAGAKAAPKATKAAKGAAKGAKGSAKKVKAPPAAPPAEAAQAPGTMTHLWEGAKGAVPAAGAGLKETGRVAKEYGKQIGGAYKTMRDAGAGRFQSVLGAGAAAPGAAATALGAGGLAAYGMGRGHGRRAQLEDLYVPKMASAVEVGDAAGRVLAKMAETGMDNTPIPMDELQESLQEARSREDIPGRARRWAIGGGTLGALGAGGAGYGIGRLIGPKAGLVGAGIGALGGGTGGTFLGKAHGAEEARADKAISMLRALRAHRMGAQHGARAGYLAGMRRGYGMSQNEGEAPEPGTT